MIDSGFHEAAPGRPGAHAGNRTTSETPLAFVPATAAVLHELSRLAGASSDLAGTAAALLRLMQSHMKLVRGRISLYDRNSGSIYIHETFGLTAEEEERGLYGLDEQTTSQVVETGKAVVIPHPGTAPGDPANHEDRSFLCLPIVRRRRVLGTISAERRFDCDELLDLDASVLGLIAAAMAQTIELYLLERVDRVTLINENRRLQTALRERFHPSIIVGSSKAMRAVCNQIEKVARTRTPVLLMGESGVGKELAAHVIHHSGPTSDGPFIQVDCSGTPAGEIESELFGLERSAITSALSPRKGRIEEADGGTIFLDEVAGLAIPIQERLVRLLQKKSIERIGGTKPVPLDLRVVAATSHDLTALVRLGTFREDLYHRLNVFPVAIPALRDRGNDVVALANHFLERCSAEMRKPVRRISSPALNLLLGYRWPGNVRELEDVIAHAVRVAEEDAIRGYHLPPSLQAQNGGAAALPGGLDAKLDSVEYEIIVEALQRHGGNMTEAARELGLTRRIFGLRMAKYHINYKDYRSGGALRQE
jgi:Nif-specific regulatory protein